MARVAPKLYEYEFPSGYAGTKNVLRLMGEWVRARSTHPEIRARVRELFRGLPQSDEEEIAAVWRHVVDGVRYLRDPRKVEYVTDPLELEREIDEGTAAEDCESIAAYAATLFAASGRESEFEIYGREPEQYTHCALRVRTRKPAGWITFDPVGVAELGESFSLGDSLAPLAGKHIERWTLDGERSDRDMYHEGSLFGALLGDTQPTPATPAPSTGESVLRIFESIGQGLSMVPGYGSIVGGAASIGTGIARAAGAGDKIPIKTPQQLAEDAKKAQAAKAAAAGGSLDPRTWSTPAKVGAALGVAGLGYLAFGRPRRG